MSHLIIAPDHLDVEALKKIVVLSGATLLATRDVATNWHPKA